MPLPLPYTKRFGLGLAARAGGMLLIAVLTALTGFDITRRVAQIQNTEQELALRREAITTLTRLRGEAERARQYKDLLVNILPSQDALIGFPREAQAMARRRELAFFIKFGEETAAAGGEPGSLSFQATANGTFEQFVAFLRDLESSRFFVALDQVELLHTGSRVAATLHGRVFSR